MMVKLVLWTKQYIPNIDSNNSNSLNYCCHAKPSLHKHIDEHKKMMLVKSTFHYIVIASEYNLVIEVMMAKQ
jgi:hypothetical protein